MVPCAGADAPLPCRPNSEMPDLRTTPTLPAKLIFGRLVEEAGEYEGVPGDGDGQLPSEKWCQRLGSSSHIRHKITKNNFIKTCIYIYMYLSNRI